MAVAVNKFTSLQRKDFSGGVNYYYGSRQINDNESPDAVNCDFKGKTGVGNRGGYTQLGAVSAYNLGMGLSEFHTSTIDQLIKFVSDGANCILSYSTGGTWTDVTGTTFTSMNMDVCQGGGKLYTGNGTEVMKEWDGANWGTTSNGTKGYYPTFYNSRIWVKDEQNADMLNFSGQYWSGAAGQGESGGATANKIGDFTTANNGGWIQFKPGSGAIITGLIPFKQYLYVLLSDSVYRIAPTSTANTFTVELVTNSVGCVSHRSISQVEEDIYFAAQDGIYSLGDVANYAAVRTTNKSGKVQRVFDGLSATQKNSLCASYYKFKYYLFYTLSGSTNNACMVYDIRYKSWQDWRNMNGVATKKVHLANNERMFFIEPTAKVQEMGLGTTDDGTAISSYWYSKSYTENFPDVLKFYFDSTFILGALNGTVNFLVIFDDTITSASATLSQNKPQGGYGRDAYGIKSYGDATNTTTVTQVINKPHRMKVKGKKFSIQYKLASSGDWRLDNISQYVSIFDHFVFTTGNKLN